MNPDYTNYFRTGVIMVWEEEASNTGLLRPRTQN